MYLKRIAAPKSWRIQRKVLTYTVRPLPGKHSLDFALSVAHVLKLLGNASTTRDVKKTLNVKPVLVDGVRVKSYRSQVGLFDQLSVEGKTFRVVLDERGRLAVVPSKNSVKPLKVRRKTVLKGGVVQVSLSDGRTILTSQPVSMGSTLLFTLPDVKSFKEVKLSEGVGVLLMKGKHAGKRGVVSALRDSLVEARSGDAVLLTKKENVFVLPEDFEL